jgi:TonB family protein
MMNLLKLLVVMHVALACFTSFVPNILKADTETEPFELNEVNTPPLIIETCPPSYPLEAKKNNIEGKVLLQFVITTDGTVRDIEVYDSSPEGVFDEAATKALEKYQFEPATKDGQPVETIVKMPIAFTIETGPLPYDWSMSPYDYNLPDRYNLLLKRSQKQIENGEYKIAIDKLTTAIKIYQKHSPAFYLRGLAYKATGEYERALFDFNRAIILNSKEPVYYDERGCVFTLIESFTRAITDFDKAIELNPDFKVAYFNRGGALKETGNYSDAIDDYTKVINMDEGNLHAYINRGYCYNKLNYTSNTCADFKKACDLGDCRGYEALKKASRCPDDVSDLIEMIQK